MADDPVPRTSHSTTQGRRFGDQNIPELLLSDPVSCMTSPTVGAGIAVAVGEITVGVDKVAVAVAGCKAGVGSDVTVGCGVGNRVET